MVFNATFNNISVISWRSVLLVEKTGVPGRNNWSATSQRLLNQRTLYDQTIFKGEVHLFVALANSAEYDCVVSIKSTSHSLCIHVTIQVTTFPAIFVIEVSVPTQGRERVSGTNFSSFYVFLSIRFWHYSNIMVYFGFTFYFFWLLFSMILAYCMMIVVVDISLFYVFWERISHPFMQIYSAYQIQGN